MGSEDEQSPSHLFYQCLIPASGGQGVGKAPSERPPVLVLGGLPPPPRRGLYMLPRRWWGMWGKERLAAVQEGGRGGGGLAQATGLPSWCTV